MTLLTAYQLLLYRYTGEEDIVVGTPIAGRSLPETEDLIGLFINTLALRTSLTGIPRVANCCAASERLRLAAMRTRTCRLSNW